MKHDLKKLEKSQVEFTITVEPAEYEADMKAAAARISEKTNIKGFRAGKAPYDKIAQDFGELKILEEALQTIVQKNFFKAVQTEKIDTIGMPQIGVEKMAPGNEVVFKATVALMPTVELPDLSKIKIEKRKVKVDAKKVDEALSHLQKMQPKEILKNEVATDKDKVIIDMDMTIDKVPVEGGQAKNHGVYLSEQYYIPGLEKELIGTKKDDKKEFTLKFPDSHYQKHLAGKNVDFSIKVHDVFELQYPELDDEFAKALGLETMDKLKSTMQENLTKEEERQEDQRVEAEMLTKIVEASKFDAIPEVIVTAEKQKMFYELKADLEQKGVELEKYLESLKKTEEQIFNDFQEGAEKRAKAALVSRQVASNNKIEVPQGELTEEIEMIKKAYKDNKQAQENLKRPEVLETIAVSLQNKKVMTYLKKEILGIEEEKMEDHKHKHECDCDDDKCKDECDGGCEGYDCEK